MPQARNFFTDAQIEKLKVAISEAEMLTSGEIRLHLETRTHGLDVLDRAAEVFADLNMHKTVKRNGVLFYLAVEDRKFAIIGDGGINAVTPDDFWENIKATMRVSFLKGEFCEGLMIGIKMAGEALQSNFPALPGDRNELPNDVSFREKKK